MRNGVRRSAMPDPYDRARAHWIYDWAGPEDVPILDRDANRTLRQANNSPALLSIRRAEGPFVDMQKLMFAAA